jgi:predicted MFS family arabinose efflux permease
MAVQDRYETYRGETGRAAVRFLALMCGAGFAMSLTAPLEVLFAVSIGYTPAMAGGFMLFSGVGVITVDVFGTRLVPLMNARSSVSLGLVMFGTACIGMAVAWTFPLMMAVRLLQGFGAGLMLGGALQAAVRVAPVDPARALARFNAGFLLGGAVGSPAGLIAAAVIRGTNGDRGAFLGTGAIALVLAAALRRFLPPLGRPLGDGPPGGGRPRLSLPRLGWGRADRSGLAIAMIGDFLRGGVLFTALPLAGAARGFPTLTIGIAIALMSLAEIVVLTRAGTVLRHLGLARVLLSASVLGCGCSAALALIPGEAAYLCVSAVFGIALAGMTIGLPLVAVGLAGDSSSGLARFRISAGVGMLAGSVGCAILGTAAGPAPLFWVVTAVLGCGACLVRNLAQLAAPARVTSS